MSEMKVGDIGVLQDMGKMPTLNESPAEIVALGNMYMGYITNNPEHYYVVVPFSPLPEGMGPATLKTHAIGIFKHQIRPLSDPDAEKETENERELVHE